MDGVAALRVALLADSRLTNLVPAQRVISGVLPQGIDLPAIGLRSISRVEPADLAREDEQYVRERIQARVVAKSYPEQKAVERAVRRAARFQLDIVVEGITDVTILFDGAGPDIHSEDTDIHIGTQDFGVSYNEDM